MAQPETPTFNDPAFNTRLEEHGGSFSAQQTEAYAERERLAEKAERQRMADNLRAVAQEVAQAADGSLDTQPIHELREKTGLRKFMNNRAPDDVVEGAEGWVLIAPSSDTVKKEPGQASLTNGAMGLILTKDGRLYAAISRPDLKPLTQRFETTERSKIDRKTFVPKERSKWYHPPVPQETFLPRYRPYTDGLPTVIGDLSDPKGGLDSDYFTPSVLDQCYDALAEFVHENKLKPVSEDPTDETVVQESEEPTEALVEAPEKATDEEKIDLWLDEGVVALHTWLGPNDIDPGHMAYGGTIGFNTVFNDMERAAKVGREAIEAHTPEATEQAFIDAGVDEIVTVSRMDQSFGGVDPESDMADEKLVRISYEVPDPKAKDSYRPGTGQTLRVRLFLPETEAKDFIRHVSADPRLIQELNDKFMSERLGGGEAWYEAKPNYEELREKRDGESKIAFRTDFDVSPQDSKIFTY